MKKLLLILSVVCLSVIMSCESNVPKPECETQNYGTVVVVNKSPNSLYVDVTDVAQGWNSVEYLPVFQSVSYHMRPGTVWLYSASPANYAKNLWVERTNSVSQCKTLNFTWTSGSKGMTIEIDAKGNVSEIYNDSDATVTRIKPNK